MLISSRLGRGFAAEPNSTLWRRLFERSEFRSHPIWSGRPEESHLQSPTEPYVNLSTHTAHVSPTVETFLLQRDAERYSLLPVTWLASPSLS